MPDAGGSQQQRQYRRARRDGVTMATACVLSGISMGEARLIEAEDAKSPPAPEAYELLETAPEPAPHTKEDDMGRASAKRAAEAAVSNERQPPNAAAALKIYREEIKPRNAVIAEKKGDLSGPYKRIKDECHFPRRVLDFLVMLEGLEDAKRDHWLLAMHTGLRELKLSRPFDLVARAEGAEPDEDIVPAGARGRPKLATVPMSDGVDADLAGEDDDHAQAAE